MAGLVELVDRAVALPPGPELSAALGALPWEKVPNVRLVEVVQARSRQLAHEQAELLAGLVEIAHAVAVDNLPNTLAGERAEAVARAGERFEWASHEIAAGLTWTPGAADRELAFATALLERLPLVFAALQHGLIDRGKARVFVDHLDPATRDITDEQCRRLCARFLPRAPGLTTKQLSDRLYRALHAIDPEFRRRRYRRAVRERGVALYLDPRSGTATLVGTGLPPDEAAAAAERIDRLVEAVKRAGHPGRRGQISADVYLGMLNGCFHGLTEEGIIHRILAAPRPEDHTDTDTDTEDVVDAGRDASVISDASGAAHGAGGGTAGATGEDADRPTPDRWARDRVAVREGIEVRVGLATLAGLDDRPGEIPGLGPIGADLARDAVDAQQRGACWKFAVVDARGHLLLAGQLRRRPRVHRDSRAGRVRGGMVELHLTVDELRRYAADPVLAEWYPVLAEIAGRWADRHELRRRLSANPVARFARGPLADHVRIRDRHCCGPGCTRPARRSDLDHTRDHSRGGATVEVNIGPACKRHHPDKDRGWTLTQPRPGRFRWVSPLGRTYLTRGEPVRPDLPDPEPAAHPRDEADVDRRVRWYDPRILERPSHGPPRPPPPKRQPATDDEPPF